MSIVHKFDATTEIGYGKFWQNSAQVMHTALTECSMSISYDRLNKRFTVLNSSSLSKSELNEIFVGRVYDMWKPEVLDTTDALGNRIVRLTPDVKKLIASPRSSEFHGSTSLPLFNLSQSHSFLNCKPQVGRRALIPRFIRDPLTEHLVPRREVIPAFSLEELAEVQNAIICSVREALTTIMSNKKTTLAGVWYPTDLDQFFKEADEVMPEDYWMGHANTEFFTKTGRFAFELKEDKLASDAIEALIVGPSVLDCGNATQLAYYKALLDVIGKDKFNKLFSGEIFKLTITQEGITDCKSPISFFADFTRASKLHLEGYFGHRPLEFGEECHFKGIQFYVNKHPVGFGGGWNVVYVGNNASGEQLFAAHGFDKPLTEREIHYLLVQEYNQDRTLQDQHFIEKANNPLKYDKNVNPDLKTQYTIPLTDSDVAVAGFLVGSCRGLLPATILLAQRTPVDLSLKVSLMNAKVSRL